MSNNLEIIQHFFSRMRCQYCHTHFDPQGIELVREDGPMFVVNVHCEHCHRHAGLAMVSVDKALMSGGKARFADPELTPKELKRLKQFEAITDDDVLEAHYYFKNADEHWAEFMKQRMTVALSEEDNDDDEGVA